MIDERLSRLLQRAYYRLRAPGALDALDALASSQWLPEEALHELQEQRLRALLRQALTHVPYYRALVADLRAAPEDFRSTDDLRSLPPLTRQQLRTQAVRLLDERVRPSALRRNATGGSTGTPITFYQDREYQRIGLAAMWRAWLLFPGYDLGVRHLRFWGADRDLPHPVVRALGRFVFNQALLNSFCATPEQMTRALDALDRSQARLLIAYASSAELLARHARRLQRRVCIPSIVTSAETLTAGQRRMLEETFDARVHNAYGCREVGAIAQECHEADSLHVNVETQVVEFEPVDPRIPDGPCRLLVTHLHNTAMPLIRYDIGDTVPAGGLRWEPCACGRTLPRMHSVAGRVSDIIRSPRGTLVHGEYFTHLFYDQDAVTAFQVHQLDLDRLVLRLVPGTHYEDRFVEDLKRWIRSDHGFTSVDVELCKEIRPEASGKVRFTRSDVDPRGVDA